MRPTPTFVSILAEHKSMDCGRCAARLSTPELRCSPCLCPLGRVSFWNQPTQGRVSAFSSRSPLKDWVSKKPASGHSGSLPEVAVSSPRACFPAECSVQHSHGDIPKTAQQLWVEIIPSGEGGFSQCGTPLAMQGNQETTKETPHPPPKKKTQKTKTTHRGSSRCSFYISF